MPYNYHSTSIAEDRAAAEKVEARAAQGEEHKHTQTQDSHQDEGTNGHSNGTGQDEAGADDAAARTVQKNYRRYVGHRTSQGRNLTSSQRWTDGMQGKKLNQANKEQNEGKNDPKSRWKRTNLYATQISKGQKEGADGKDAADLNSDEEMDALAKNDKERDQIKKERQVSKQMEHQYWLEMCDSKHRYGTNLKWYHQKWNDEYDGQDNFFHWLDEGDGKDVDCEQCPRTRLEKERITYLNAEQRQNYKVIIQDGQLVWAKSGKPLDTTKYFRDAGPNEGIVEMTEDEVREKEAEEKAKRRERRKNLGQDPDTSSSSSDEEQEENAERKGVKGYSDKGGTAGKGKGLPQMKARIKYYLGPTAILDRFLRETMSKNTWLFVADMENNLYVGLKQTGRFQHSSFLYGGRVTAAGLIKADKGHLTSLSPLSGHYRAGTMHFKAFVRSLEERGCDMSRVNITKAVATIQAIEKYGGATKKRSRLIKSLKDKLHISHVDPEEEQKKQDDEDVQAIEKDEHDSPIDVGKEEREEDDDRLPGDGKDVSEMTEEERMERGLALVARAWQTGLDAKVKKSAEAGEKGKGDGKTQANGEGEGGHEAGKEQA